MYDVNQFTIIGKFLKLESHRNNVFFYLKTDNNEIIKIVINKGIQERLAPFYLNDKTIAIKGYISSDNRKNILLYATKLFFLSDKH